MLDAEDREVWAQNGYAYAQSLMAENDGSAEAKILLMLAQRKHALTTKTPEATDATVL